jgi:hypothetical protein
MTNEMIWQKKHSTTWEVCFFVWFTKFTGGDENGNSTEADPHISPADIPRRNLEPVRLAWTTAGQ